MKPYARMFAVFFASLLLAACSAGRTGVVGGVLRDIVAGQPSILLQREIYVTAAIVGAIVTVLLSAPAGLQST